MTTIVSIMNPKGGVAKTTTTVSLASALSQTFKVAIVDMDVQSSIKTYLGKQTKIKLYKAKRLGHLTSLPTNTKAQKFDFILIDTPASLKDKHVEAIAAISNFVIVPSKASQLDIAPTLNFIDKTLIPNQTPFKVLLTQVIPATRYHESVKEKLEAQHIPMFNTITRQYQSYMQAVHEQTSIFGLGASAASAQNDYRNVAHELLEAVQPISMPTENSTL